MCVCVNRCVRHVTSVSTHTQQVRAQVAALEGGRAESSNYDQRSSRANKESDGERARVRARTRAIERRTDARRTCGRTEDACTHGEAWRTHPGKNGGASSELASQEKRMEKIDQYFVCV